MKIDQVTKSLTAAVISGAGALQTANSDQVVTAAEWVTVASVFVTALVLVWAVPNTPQTNGSTPAGLLPLGLTYGLHRAAPSAQPAKTEVPL